MSNSESLSLFVEASETALTIAVKAADTVVSKVDPKKKDTLERMFPIIDSLLASLGHVYKDVTDIYVTLGPGSNTGLRMALTQARVFWALKPSARLFAVSTYGLLAALGNRPSMTVVVSDRHNGFFFADYENNAKTAEGHVDGLDGLNPNGVVVYADQDSVAKALLANNPNALAVDLGKALSVSAAFKEYTPDHVAELVPDYSEKI